MLRETTLVCRDVLRSALCATLSAVDSDISGTWPYYLFRFTSTSISSEPVWKTFELAV